MAVDREAATVNLFRNYEARTAFAPAERRRLPTTLVTGWLGSGKTTVMRHVLANRQDLKVACAVNDFAELNIDAELVARSDTGARGENKGIVELTNGCLCCTLGGELETQVWRMLDDARDREDDGTGRVDYLLIETSGLVDPTETVAALDKTFGKLARVRLDSVVCVVDAESAASGEVAGYGGGDGGGGAKPEEAWARQLSAADVVLLSKIDLLDGDDEKLAAARAFVRRWAPDAKVTECVDGKVSLPSILDVELAPQPEGKIGHDWDSAARPFLLSSTGGGLRKKSEGSTATAGPFVIDPSKRTSHRNRNAAAAAAATDASAFGSASFEGGALSLARFQRWVAREIPREVVRAKGFVQFAEAPGCVYDFHLSGRRRIELELVDGDGDGGARGGFSRAPAKRQGETRLVLIGPGLDPEACLATLRGLEATGGDADDAAAATKTAEKLRAARERLTSDARLEVVDPDASWCASEASMKNCAYFRLTGAESNGFTVNELEKTHGVDFNRMNLELVRALNSRGAGVVAAAATATGVKTRFGGDVILLRVAVDGDDDDGGGGGGVLSDAGWDVLRDVCTGVLRRHIGHVPKCRCGF